MKYLLAALFFAACLIFGILFIKAMERDEHIKATVLKGITTVWCMAVALVSLFNTGNQRFAILILFGLFFGMWGDVLLALRFAFTEKFNTFFLTGAASFFIGHIFYVIALYGLAPDAWKIAVPLTLVALGIELINSKKHNLDMGKLFVPMGIYAALVCFMGCSAVGTCIMSFGTSSLLFAIAGISFMVSDSILSVQCFSDHPSNGKNRVLHVFYWAAQFLIALSPMFL